MWDKDKKESVRKRKKECEKEHVLGKYGMQKKKADTEKQEWGAWEEESVRVQEWMWGHNKGHNGARKETLAQEKMEWP